MATATSRLPYIPEQAKTQVFTLGHRPELDGLRGVSILLVLLLHLRLFETTGVFGLPGGFLGVDIFFVLSGFLITSLLVQEFDRTGSISLKGFYLRRALRLGPALAVLIPLACLFAIFAGAQRHETLQGAWLTLSYVSNWFYAFGYGSPLDPLGITWSLAIEEQFYLVWPLTLALLLRSGVRRGWILGMLVFLVALVGVHRFALASNGATVERMYYATDTRADGLLIGCIVGLLLSWGLVRSAPKILASIGAALLALLVLFVPGDAALYYFGGFTVVALSVGAIIARLMFSPSRLALALLRHPVLVWIGKVSYGLYLWHWTVIDFTFPEHGRPSIVQFVSAVALSFAFTALSFYLIEKRFLALKDRINPRLKNHRIGL